MPLKDEIAPLVDLVEKLVDQNSKLNCRLIAMENILAYTLAQTFLGRDKSERGLAELKAEISGTALAIADRLRPLDDLGVADFKEIPKSMERVISLAEKTLQLSLQRRAKPADGSLHVVRISPSACK